jgi:hypothetical protein
VIHIASPLWETLSLRYIFKEQERVIWYNYNERKIGTHRMNNLKRSLLLTTILVLIVLIARNGFAEINNLDRQEKALRVIDAFAERLCSIPLEGKANNFDLSGSAKFELKKFISKLVGLGVEGAARYQSSKWEGMLQKDLASLIAKKIECKKEIWRDLKDKLLPASPKSVKQKNEKAAENKQTLQQPPINARDSNVIVGPVTGDINQTLITTKARSRLLTDEQKERFTNFLKDKPKGFIQVGWTMDGEAGVLGPQLALILGSAGWKYKESSVSFSPIGISLITGDKATDINTLSPAAAALATGLINVGLNINITYDSSLPPNTFVLGIGQRE